MASLTDPKATAVAMAAAKKMRQRRSSSSVNNATATMRLSISDVVNVHVRPSMRKLLQGCWISPLQRIGVCALCDPVWTYSMCVLRGAGCSRAKKQAEIVTTVLLTW